MNTNIEEMRDELIKYLDIRYPNVERWKYEAYVDSIILFMKDNFTLHEQQVREDERTRVIEELSNSKRDYRLDDGNIITGLTMPNIREILTTPNPTTVE